MSKIIDTMIIGATIRDSILARYNSFLISFFFRLLIIMHSTPYMNGRATTLGVFKAYVVFFIYIFFTVNKQEGLARKVFLNIMLCSMIYLCVIQWKFIFWTFEYSLTEKTERKSRTIIMHKY